ncbi:MAG: D-tyrosyl-tRNA(Tyr) deacylase [Thermoflavifilum sp.]|nr:D-tyrosyl-tRNA(Tyr) deacylase [Thermoflavifilum sp.]MCL6512848.1 D-tyrosyl-tRNA(Tyr) deacylase [Alicyclobacillus sp.]
MRVVVQRVSEAAVRVEDNIVGRIGRGFLVLVGVRTGDTEADAEYLAEKVAYLRVFPDEHGKMNHDLFTAQGAVLSVSQFTLYGDCRKGRRPNYMAAAAPDEAVRLYEAFNQALRARGVHVETGQFGAMMQVSLVNDGPVTLIIDSRGDAQ